jgi:starvation-inducible DNA-binding protein
MEMRVEMNNLVDGYKVFLASNFTLYLKTHNAHFNVTGMFFPQLHDLFKAQYDDMWLAFDQIGENIRKLDAFTPATLTDFKKFSVVDDFDSVLAAKDYIERLYMDHERMIILLAKVFKLAEGENKQADMEFISGRMDLHAKHRWMLKTLLNSL